MRAEAARRDARTNLAAKYAVATVLEALTSHAAAGWPEGGLAIGYEKFVLDDDQLGMMG